MPVSAATINRATHQEHINNKWRSHQEDNNAAVRQRIANHLLASSPTNSTKRHQEFIGSVHEMSCYQTDVPCSRLGSQPPIKTARHLSLYFSVHIVFKFEVQSSIYPKVNGRVILEAARTRGSEVKVFDFFFKTWQPRSKFFAHYECSLNMNGRLTDFNLNSYSLLLDGFKLLHYIARGSHSECLKRPQIQPHEMPHNEKVSTLVPTR
jgi:hypothetical protein